jgi:hypothetical protein
MTFTLDKLARAMRGMPRDARIMIRLPGGKLVELDLVTATHTRTDSTDETVAGDGGRYTIVLAPESGGEARLRAAWRGE